MKVTLRKKVADSAYRMTVGQRPRRATGPIYAPNGEQVHAHRTLKANRHRVCAGANLLGWVEWTEDGLWLGERKADGMVRFHLPTKRDAILWVVYRAGEA